MIQRKPNGQFVKGNKEGHRFTSEDQPDPEKISEGRQKQIKEDNTIEAVCIAFCNTLSSDEVKEVFAKVGFNVRTKLQTIIAQVFTQGLSSKAPLKDKLALLEFIGKYTRQEPAQKIEVEDKPIINIDIPR